MKRTIGVLCIVSLAGFAWLGRQPAGYRRRSAERHQSTPARATRTQAKSARMGALYGRWQRSRQRHHLCCP